MHPEFDFYYGNYYNNYGYLTGVDKINEEKETA